MRSAGRYIITFIAMSLLIGMVIGGCSDEDTDCPVCPGTSAPTMDNLWPNEDGNSWTYDWMRRRWENDPWTLYENPGDVVAVPSFEYVEALLGDESTGAGADTILGIFRLEFDGTCVGDSGATGQCLVETIYDGWNDQITMVSFESTFFDRLRTARPDLESAIKGIDGRSNAPADIAAIGIARTPLILHGGVWEKTADYIGTYGDLDALLAWKFLESDISTGHEFTFQLIPSLASDIFMHCRVLGRGTIETGYGTYKNAVECLYIIDHGLASMQLIEETRYFRVYDYGTITYAPGTGPVLSYERMLIDTTVPDGPGFGDHRMELIGNGGE